MKKLLSCVLSLTCAVSAFAVSGFGVSAEETNKIQTYEDKFGTYGRTLMYYNKDSKDIYIAARQYWHSGDRVGGKYWYYTLNDDNTYSQNKKLAYRIGAYIDDTYYKDYQEIPQTQLESELFEYENDSNLVSIDLNNGMSDIEMGLSSYVDYSYINHISLTAGEKITLKPKVILNTDSSIQVKWKSNDESVATVSENGEVTGKSNGECTISANIDGVSKSISEYTVTVSDSSQSSRESTQTSEVSTPESSVKVSTSSEEKNIYESASSEKEAYDNLYTYYNDSNADGHVITDLDGDGTYELITRSKDRRTIKIFKYVNGEIKTSSLEPDSSVVQANLNYTEKNCYFNVIKNYGADKYKIKVFEYRNSDYKLHNIFEYECEKRERHDGMQYTVNDNSPSSEESAKIREYEGWQESFNDDCTEVTNSDKEIIPINSVAGLMRDFAYRYYKDGDMVLLSGEASSANGLNPITIKYLALNEIYARNGMKSSNPIYLSFFNKKSYYNATMDSTEFTKEFLDNHFNNYEKQNIDNINDAQFGSR